jgi:hypothetical protein
MSIRKRGNVLSKRRLEMSDERDMRTGRHADQSEPDDEVKAHVKSGRGAADAAAAEGTGDDVEAHVKSSRGASGDDGEDEVKAHVKSGR